MKKQQIQELIDDNGNIIGKNTKPEVSPDKDTEANGTTDTNVQMHGQNFKNDFLGRFGFYFYEGEQVAGDKSIVEEEISEIVGEDNAVKVMEVLKPHIKEFAEKYNPYMNERRVIEDKLVNKKRDSLKPKKNDDKILDSKLEKVADILSKLPKDDINKIIGLLEKKK